MLEKPWALLADRADSRPWPGACFSSGRISRLPCKRTEIDFGSILVARSCQFRARPDLPGKTTGLRTFAGTSPEVFQISGGIQDRIAEAHPAGTFATAGQASLGRHG